VRRMRCDANLRFVSCLFVCLSHCLKSKAANRLFLCSLIRERIEKSASQPPACLTPVRAALYSRVACRFRYMSCVTPSLRVHAGAAARTRTGATTSGRSVFPGSVVLDGARSKRAARSTEFRSMRPPKARSGKHRGGAVVLAAASNDPSDAPVDNAYTRFQAGIAADEREAVQESYAKIMRWGDRRHQKDLQKEDVLGATTKVGVMGGGSFGTAMATLLARNKTHGLDVVILVRSQDDADAINHTHRNAKYLPQWELPESVRATIDPAEALVGADFIIHAVPVQSSKKFLAGVKDFIDPTTPILCLSKGLEVGSCEMMSQVIPNGLGRAQPLAVLSGPTFAVELMQGLPTAIVAASESAELAWRVQRLFSSSCLRVNTSTDVVGVEMSGALKNVLAIAAGIVDGLELGNNALAAVVAQGCAEIRWLAQRMGAKPATLAGLSGTGDMYVLGLSQIPPTVCPYKTDTFFYLSQNADVLRAVVPQPNRGHAPGRGGNPGRGFGLNDASRGRRRDRGGGDETGQETQGIPARAHRRGQDPAGRRRPERSRGAGHEFAAGAGGVIGLD
jgi:glycerol-3-phosphate dehydrogenase (NAD+)